MSKARHLEQLITALAHRSVHAPAFPNGMLERLWLEMRDIVRDMVEEERWIERTSLEYQRSTPVTHGSSTLAAGELLVQRVVGLTLRMSLIPDVGLISNGGQKSRLLASVRHLGILVGPLVACVARGSMGHQRCHFDPHPAVL
jgi:hypothetical protein